jgi:AcrR family transcriptional regulator
VIARSTRGRQAEALRNDRALLDAAREVFATGGPDEPVSAVAERAGVGVASLYRRYGSKTELLQSLCTQAMLETLQIAREALAHEDAWAGIEHYVRRCVEIRAGALAPLAGRFETTPQMWRLSREGRRALGELLARAQNAGSVRSDVTVLDVAWLIELFGRRPADSDAPIGRLVSLALDGLRPGSPVPLPGRPPSAHRYEGRWR